MRSCVIDQTVALLAALVSAQAPPRRATNIAALLGFPAYFHGRQVIVVGQVETASDGKIRATDGIMSIRVVFQGSAPDGNDEIRGEFWDLGRMKSDDPRFARIDLKSAFGVDPEGAWPRAGEVTALMASGVTRSSIPVAPSIRTIVLNPARYVNQKVTVTGQFTGRNLTGDLPDAPAKSRWDFVIRSTDAALWVSGADCSGSKWATTAFNSERRQPTRSRRTSRRRCGCRPRRRPKWSSAHRLRMKATWR